MIICPPRPHSYSFISLTIGSLVISVNGSDLESFSGKRTHDGEQKIRVDNTHWRSSG